MMVFTGTTQGVVNVNKRPPLEVFATAAIASGYGGWLLAEALVPVVYQGDLDFTVVPVICFLFGLGLLQGWKFFRAWLVVLSGLVVFSFGAGLISQMIFPSTEVEAWAGTFALIPLSITAFLCLRSPAVLEWCQSEGQSFKASSLLASVFFLLGLVIALPGKMEIRELQGELSKQRDVTQRIRLIWTEFSFQTKTQEPVREEVDFLGEQYGPRFEEEYNAHVTGSSHRNPDGSTRILVGGLTTRPVIVSFSASGYANYDFTITNGCPREVLLTFRPAYTNLSKPTKTK